MIFKVERDDAERAARVFGRVDPLAVKHEMENAAAQGRSHPVYYGLPEQWELWVQALQGLQPREALVKLPNGVVTKIHTIPVPDPNPDPQRVKEVKEHYLRTYFRPQAEIERDLAQHRRPDSSNPAPIGRIELADDLEA